MRLRRRAMHENLADLSQLRPWSYRMRIFQTFLNCLAEAAPEAVADDAVPLADEVQDPAAQALPAPLTLDTSSATTDLSVNVPTGWWFYTGISAAQVSNYLNTNSARLQPDSVQAHDFSRRVR